MNVNTTEFEKIVACKGGGAGITYRFNNTLGDSRNTHTYWHSSDTHYLAANVYMRVPKAPFALLTVLQYRVRLVHRHLLVWEPLTVEIGRHDDGRVRRRHGLHRRRVEDE